MSWHYYPINRINHEGNYEQAIRALPGCCGVGEMRAFVDVSSNMDGYKRVSDLSNGPYTGIFVCTYTKRQQNDGLEEELNKYHTLQYQTDFHINTGPHAGDSGKTEGVRTAIYKWGKE